MEILKEQDFLGTNERLEKFANILDESMRTEYETLMKRFKTSEERWNAFSSHFTSQSQKVLF